MKLIGIVLNFVPLFVKAVFIRAKEYFRYKDVIDFYQNFYRKENYYEHQKNVSSSDKFYDRKVNLNKI